MKGNLPRFHAISFLKILPHSVHHINVIYLVPRDAVSFNQLGCIIDNGRGDIVYRLSLKQEVMTSCTQAGKTMCSTKQLVNIIHSEEWCTLEVSVKENLWPVSVTWYRIHCCLLQLPLKTFWHCSSRKANFGHCYSYFWTLVNINICPNACSY